MHPITPDISDYALIGDTRAATLCSKDGSIDWLCLPRFDSEPIFGRIVGGDQAGSFSIAPQDVVGTRRRYRHDSAILETIWRTSSGGLMLTEGMVTDTSFRLLPQTLLVRRIRCTHGSARVRVTFDPRRGLPGRPPRTRSQNGALVCSWGSLAMALQVSPQLDLEPGQERDCELTRGEELTFVMGMADRQPLVFVAPETAWSLLEQTDSWWREWAADVSYGGAFREAFVRSLITLRLLTYAPSGAPVAAPTTSLPETIGGGRNWDYRFSWPRDASIGIGAFLGAGKMEEAHSFMHWLLHATRLTRPRLEVLYTVHGKPGPDERSIRNIPGYQDSLPVRTGNAASTQHQLDVYGWVVDAAWLLSRARGRLHGETWRVVQGLADHVAARWTEPDAGIWEVRGDLAHYVHSKMMAWLALDRVIRIARTHPVRPHRLRRWHAERDALVEQIRTKGFNEERGTYIWTYGGDKLDAALLLLPTLEFEEEGSPRTSETVNTIRTALDAGEGLLYRYPPGADGLDGVEGAFLPCSFWLVQALARLGRLNEARQVFQSLLTMANDVGLFSEEIDPASEEPLGNFPQAFTHASLIQAVLAIEEAGRRAASPRNSEVG